MRRLKLDALEAIVRVVRVHGALLEERAITLGDIYYLNGRLAPSRCTFRQVGVVGDVKVEVSLLSSDDVR